MQERHKQAPAHPRRGFLLGGRDNNGMDNLFFWLALGAVVWIMKQREQRQRIVLLAQHLQKFQLEQLMAQLTQGYLRALGERDAERSAAIWQMLQATEATVSEQLQRLARDMAQISEPQARVLRWPLALPWVTQWLPAASLDVRQLMNIHAQGFADTVRNVEGLSRKDQAFRLTAELLLFQHSCHWFCRSKLVASARLLARQQTRYEQVLAAVSPATRAAYAALVN